MASVNKVIIVGYLGRNPEIRITGSGDAFATINVATTETWKDQSGESKKHTEWHRVVFFGKLAELADQFLKKGSLVYVEGSLRSTQYRDKNDVERHGTEIRADSFQALDKASSGYIPE